MEVPVVKEANPARLPLSPKVIKVMPASPAVVASPVVNLAKKETANPALKALPVLMAKKGAHSKNHPQFKLEMKEQNSPKPTAPKPTPLDNSKTSPAKIA